jgi:hypothetical protein
MIKRHVLWLQAGWVFVGLVLLGISVAPVIDGDGAARYSDLLRIANGDKPLDKFSSLQMLLSMPLHYFGALFGVAKEAVSYFNYVVFLLMLIGLWFFLPRPLRFTAIVLLMATSMFPHHLRYYYGEVLSVCAVTLGIILLVQSRNIVAAVLLGIGTAQTPATLPALAMVLLYVSIRRRNLRYLLIFLVPLFLMCLDNWFKYDSVFSSPYLTAAERAEKTLMPYSGLPGFSYPIVFGLLSILFSFGKGLTFFTPGLWLRWKLSLAESFSVHRLNLIDVCLVFLLGLILTYSRWYGWYGGQFWGPRFFLFASIPATLILAYFFSYSKATWRLSALFIAVLVLSGWVCIQGYLYGNLQLSICGENKSQLELLCWYVPEFSPIFREFVVGFPQVPPLRLAYVAWCLVSVLFIAFAWRASKTVTSGIEK